MEKSYFQQKAELSRFDDSVVRERRAQEAANFQSAAQNLVERQAPVVPLRDNAVYEPTNPNADWGGYVSRDMLQRTHFNDHAAHRETVSRSDMGILPREDAKTMDLDHVAGRKHFQKDARFHSSETSHDAPLIGGPTVSQRMQSSYDSQSAFEATNQEFMGRKKASGRRHVQPAHETAVANSRGSMSRLMPHTHAEDMREFAETAAHDNSLIGYRAKVFSSNGPSLLGGMGSKLNGKLDLPNQNQALTVPRRDVLVDQRASYGNSAIPGYTGTKRG